MATFTSSEQDCISAKVRKLIGEGSERDQAVAVAIKTCAPGKATSAAAPLAKSYRVTREGTGFRVHQVPIFAEHQRNVFGEVVQFDALWLIEAARRAEARSAHDGYLSPVHIEHHGDGNRNERVGFMDRLTVGKSLMEGKDTYVLFADWLIESSKKLSAIKGFPYRSVEVADAEKPEIASLAVMESAAPWFRFPLFRMDLPEGGLAPEGPKARAEESAVSRAAEVLAGAIGWKVRHPAFSILYQLPVLSWEEPMADTDKTHPESDGDEAPELDKKDHKSLKKVLDLLTKIGEKLGVDLSDAPEKPEKPEKPDEMSMGPAPAGLPMAPKAEAPVDLASAAADTARRALAGSTPVTINFSNPSHSDRAGSLADTVRLAALEGELSAAKREIGALKASSVRDEMVRATAKTLEAQFGHLTDEDRIALGLYAAAGPEALAAWVSGWKTHAVNLPGPGAPEEPAASRPSGDLPEVEVYRAQGKDVLEMARYFSLAYDAQPAGMRRQNTRKQFIAANMNGAMRPVEG